MEEPMSAKQKSSARSSRRLSNSSRASSVLSNLNLPEADLDASWRKYLVELLGEDDANYFLHPKPKEQLVVIDKSLYGCHGLDDAWQKLRNRSDARLQAAVAKRSRSLGTKNRFKVTEDDHEDLDKSYFAFGRYLLMEKGRNLPVRAFWGKESQFKEHLEKLSDKNRTVRVARYNQETGVSFRAACTNTDRCHHLIENATNKGGSVFNNERKTGAAVFMDDFSQYTGSPSTSHRLASSMSKTSSKVKAQHPKFIFLTEEDAAQEVLEPSKLWSKRNVDIAASPVITNESRLAEASKPDSSRVSVVSAEKWEPLSLPAAAEWSLPGKA